MIKILANAALGLALVPTLATAAPRGGLDTRPRHGAPEFPQSSYASCAGKSIGDAATDGQVTGTCQRTKDGRVALRPSVPPPPDPATPAPTEAKVK